MAACARHKNEESLQKVINTCLVSAAASDPVSVMMNVGTFLRHALLPRTRGNLQSRTKLFASLQLSRVFPVYAAHYSSSSVVLVH